MNVWDGWVKPAGMVALLRRSWRWRLPIPVLGLVGMVAVAAGFWGVAEGAINEGDGRSGSQDLLADYQEALYREDTLAGRLAVVAGLASVSLEAGLFDREVDTFLVGDGLLADQFEYHFLRGEMYYYAGDYRAARKEWLLADAIEAENEHLALRLYQMAELAGDVAEMVRLGRVYHRLSPGGRSALCLGRALIAAGLTEEAFDAVESAGIGAFSEFDEFRLLIRYAMVFEVLDRLVVLMERSVGFSVLPPKEALAVAEMWIAAGESERAREALWGVYGAIVSDAGAAESLGEREDLAAGGFDNKGAALRYGVSVVRQRFNQLKQVSGPGGLSVSRKEPEVSVGMRLQSFLLLALISGDPQARQQLVEDLSDLFATHPVSLSHQAEAWLVLRQMERLGTVIGEMEEGQHADAEEYLAAYERLRSLEDGVTDAAAVEMAAGLRRQVEEGKWHDLAEWLLGAFNEAPQAPVRRRSVQHMLVRPLHDHYLSGNVLRPLQRIILLSGASGILHLDAALRDIGDADPGVELRVLALRYYLAWAAYDDAAAVEIAGCYLELDSNDALRYDRALLLRDLGRFDEAVAEWSRLAAAAPGEPLTQAARIRLVQLLLARGDLAGAKDTARRLVAAGLPGRFYFENTLRALGLDVPRRQSAMARTSHHIHAPQSRQRRELLNTTDLAELARIGGQRADDVQLQRSIIGRLLRSEDRDAVLSYLDANPTVSILSYIDQQSIPFGTGLAVMGDEIRVVNGYRDAGRLDDLVERLLWEHEVLHEARPFLAGVSRRGLENVIQYLYEQGEYAAAVVLYERLSLGRELIRHIQYHSGAERLLEIYLASHEALGTDLAEVASRLLGGLAAARLPNNVPLVYGEEERPASRSGMFQSQNSQLGMQHVALFGLFDRIQSPELLGHLVDHLNVLPVDDSEQAFGYPQDRDVLAAYVGARLHAPDALELVRKALRPVSPDQLTPALSNVLKDRALSLAGGYQLLLAAAERDQFPHRPRWRSPQTQPQWGDFMLDLIAAMRAGAEDDPEAAGILLNRALVTTGGLGDTGFRYHTHFRLWAEAIMEAGLAYEMEDWMLPIRVADSMAVSRRMDLGDLVQGWMDFNREGDDAAVSVSLWPVEATQDGQLTVAWEIRPPLPMLRTAAPQGGPVLQASGLPVINNSRSYTLRIQFLEQPDGAIVEEVVVPEAGLRGALTVPLAQSRGFIRALVDGPSGDADAVAQSETLPFFRAINLIANPRLEAAVDALTGTVSIPGWSLPAVLPMVADNGPSYGFPATYLTLGATHQRVTVTSDPWPIDPNKTYRLSCWIDIFGTPDYSVGIQFLDSKAQPIGEVLALPRPPGPVWEWVTRDFGPEIKSVPQGDAGTILHNWCGAFTSTAHVREIPPQTTAARVVINAGPILRIADLSFVEIGERELRR